MKCLDKLMSVFQGAYIEEFHCICICYVQIIEFITKDSKHVSSLGEQGEQ